MECHEMSCSPCARRIFGCPFRHDTIVSSSGSGYSIRFRHLFVIGIGSSSRSGFTPAAGLRRGLCFARIARVCVRGCGRAYRGGAVRARDCPRETPDAPRPSVPAGVFFAAPSHRFLQKRRKAAPEAASLYFHSTPYRQMSSPPGNKKESSGCFSHSPLNRRDSRRFSSSRSAVPYRRSRPGTHRKDCGPQSSHESEVDAVGISRNTRPSRRSAPA